MDSEIVEKAKEILLLINTFQKEHEDTDVMGFICFLYYEVVMKSIEEDKYENKLELIDFFIEAIDKTKQSLNQISMKLIAMKGDK